MTPHADEGPFTLIGVYCPGCRHAQEVTTRNYDTVIRSHVDHVGPEQDIHPIKLGEDIEPYRRVNLMWPKVPAIRRVRGAR